MEQPSIKMQSDRAFSGKRKDHSCAAKSCISLSAPKTRADACVTCRRYFELCLSHSMTTDSLEMSAHSLRVALSGYYV